ncbi:transglycosylase SLT domain-containing protein [Basilea psittacipulmonis]|uniref:transglycosylase SLT domain-containing protein n=1 Tax=Basilea psittacipulmonis TaxID=1472345 RepID=UPI00068FBBDE|nr:transglycosylase SLT domain-containing protein [Basilea psittacipulmonis]
MNKIDESPKLLTKVISNIRLYLHLSSVYIGLCVLVIMLAVWVLPTARMQVKQMYSAVVYSFNHSPFLSADVDVLTEDGELVQHQEVTEKTTAVKPGFFTRLLSHDHQKDVDVPEAQFYALRDSLVRKYKIAPAISEAIISKAFEQGKLHNLDPLLILAVIAIESRYNPFVQSSVGAQGLMQVMPDVHSDKFKNYSGSMKSALNPESNIEVGSIILRNCIRKRSTVDGGLACYVGASVPSRDGGYARKVQAERRRLALDSGMALRKNLGKD